MIEIGDRVLGYDPDYEQHFEGVVQDVQETCAGHEAFVINVLPGPFEGKRVALPVERWQRIQP